SAALEALGAVRDRDDRADFDLRLLAGARADAAANDKAFLARVPADAASRVERDGGLPVDPIYGQPAGIEFQNRRNGHCVTQLLLPRMIAKRSGTCGVLRNQHEILED